MKTESHFSVWQQKSDCDAVDDANDSDAVNVNEVVQCLYKYAYAI